MESVLLSACQLLVAVVGVTRSFKVAGLTLSIIVLLREDSALNRASVLVSLASLVMSGWLIVVNITSAAYGLFQSLKHMKDDP